MLNFLGGIAFALILIGTTALLVIVGTFHEAIYATLFFKILLSLFFINILCAALRRYPFQKKHIPFLICHLGLLLILAGALTKSLFGTQTSLSLMEGERIEPPNIPHTVRLRQARKIPYSGTDQPYSYEADLLVDEKEVTLSMNHVYHSDLGYRFYLSTIATSPERAKKIQLIVNRDPGKYILTYPGILFLSLGILLLFFRKKKHVSHTV